MDRDHIEAELGKSETLRIGDQKPRCKSTPSRTLSRPRDGGRREIDTGNRRPGMSEFLRHHTRAAAHFEHRPPGHLGAELTKAAAEFVFDQKLIESSATVRPRDLELGVALLVVKRKLTLTSAIDVCSDTIIQQTIDFSFVRPLKFHARVASSFQRRQSSSRTG